jgi:hypothetical protein
MTFGVCSAVLAWGMFSGAPYALDRMQWPGRSSSRPAARCFLVAVTCCDSLFVLCDRHARHARLSSPQGSHAEEPPPVGNDMTTTDDKTTVH